MRRGCEAGRGRDGRQFSPEARLEARRGCEAGRGEAGGEAGDEAGGEAGGEAGIGRQAGLEEVGMADRRG